MNRADWDKQFSAVAELLYENNVDRHEIDHKATNYMNTNFGPRPGPDAPKMFVSDMLNLDFRGGSNELEVEYWDDQVTMDRTDIERLHKWTTEVVDWIRQHDEV